MTAGGVRLSVVALGIVALVCGAWFKSGVYRTPCPETLCTSRATPQTTQIERFPYQPECASHNHDHDRWMQKVEIRNDCEHAITFVVRAVGGDSPCINVQPRNTSYWRWSRLLGLEGVHFGCVEDS